MTGGDTERSGGVYNDAAILNVFLFFFYIQVQVYDNFFSLFIKILTKPDLDRFDSERVGAHIRLFSPRS